MTWGQKHRRSIRLPGYDYSQAGAYFVTICVQDRVCLFGEIVDGEMRLNDAGRMVERWWAELNRKFSAVQTDAYVVMPNHFHGIVIIVVGADLRVCPYSAQLHAQGAHAQGAHAQGAHAQGAHAQGAHAQGAHAQGAHIGAPLPEIVQWFKTMTTNEYIRGVKTSGWPTFRGRLWQRNYYEHIIRNDESLQRIQRYIAENPLRWEMDRENPNTTKIRVS
ncbi:MAG: transposase [Planctomycetota bacterium]